MLRYIFFRILQGLATLIGLSIIVFLLSRAAGDPVLLLVGPDVPVEEMEAVRHELGLDRPLIAQYFTYVGDMVTGDLGRSIFTHLPVSELILERFPATLKLTFATVIFALPVGILIGVFCALKRNRLGDIMGRTIAVIAQSMPSFWVGIMLVLVFSVRWEVFPAAGMDGPISYFLPVLAMGGFLVAGVARLTRSSMLEVLGAEFIAFARARGTPEASVVFRHALRNAAIPVLTLAAVLTGYLLMGSVVTEVVFAWPGLGRLAYQAIASRDFPIVQSVVLFYGGIFILINLFVDILYGWLDPRIRYT